MDRWVLVAVALALLVATQAQADEWFDAHCLESRSIVASAQPEAAPFARKANSALSGMPSRNKVRARRPAGTRPGR